MQSNRQKGMTLIELTVVLLVLIAMAGLAIPYVGGTNRMALCQATDASMQAVKSAIMGGGANAGFYMDLLGQYPRDKARVNDYDLSYLFVRDDGLDNDSDTHLPSPDGRTNVDPDDEWRAYNPKTAVGWRGPYLMSGVKAPAGLDNSFKNIYDSATATTNKVHTNISVALGSRILDAWGRPIIIQVPYDSDTNAYKLDYARLVSAGVGQGLGAGKAAIETKIEYDSSVGAFLPDASDRGDDRVLYLRMPDPYADGNQPCDS